MMPMTAPPASTGAPWRAGDEKEMAMNSAVKDVVNRIEETYFCDPPEGMDDLKLRMWSDIALLIGIVKGQSAKMAGEE